MVVLGVDPHTGSVVGRRERRRRRWASGKQREILGRPTLRGPKPGRRTRGLGFDRPSWFAALVGVALGGALLAIGIDSWRDHQVLDARGVVTVGQIVEVRGGKTTYLTVRFTTATGEQVTAEVTDPGTGTRQEVGAPIRLRYDPDDPAGRVADADDDAALGTRWILVIGGAALLAATGWAMWRRPHRPGR
ncbi:Protein of unknown function [Micromonospora echinaurantiaca]|uniref:DUF3592 domain-containing protein n=1 Tax=Micromonospora echinaurantiaca TaxID=47857 RepID=A0A1C5I8T2_9ACTN|nr:Protein of unknown function [Micromonospora echinaurantiaca]